MKYLFLIVTCISIVNVQAQINLVRNPGFEIFTYCPPANDFVSSATGWNGIDSNWVPGGSYPHPYCLPDYINSCAITTSGVSVPLGTYYYQYPHSGKGMMGIRFYDDGSTVGFICLDYLQVA